MNSRLGYRQGLKRSLGLASLVPYGLLFVSPTSPISIFGAVYNLSHAMVPLVHLVGFIAMGFTAFSYATMARASPIAGPPPLSRLTATGAYPRRIGSAGPTQAQQGICSGRIFRREAALA
jgi:amino acid transporter